MPRMRLTLRRYARRREASWRCLAPVVTTGLPACAGSAGASAARASLRAQRDRAGERARPLAHRVAVVAALHHPPAAGSMAGDQPDVMRPHHDDARTGRDRMAQRAQARARSNAGPGSRPTWRRIHQRRPTRAAAPARRAARACAAAMAPARPAPARCGTRGRRIRGAHRSADGPARRRPATSRRAQARPRSGIAAA